MYSLHGVFGCAFAVKLTVVVSNHSRWDKVIWVSLLLYNVYLIVCVSDFYIDYYPSESISFLSRLCGSWKSWSKMALDKIHLSNQVLLKGISNPQSSAWRMSNLLLMLCTFWCNFLRWNQSKSETCPRNHSK